MKEIKVPFGGKGYKVSYTVETIDTSTPGLDFLNLYTVFVNDEEIQKYLGKNFTIIHNHLQYSTPGFEIKSPGSAEENNLKKQIAQQIINNPTE